MYILNKGSVNSIPEVKNMDKSYHVITKKRHCLFIIKKCAV